MCSGDIRILGRAAQSLAGEANTVPRAEMPILGRNINPVGAEALWVRYWYAFRGRDAYNKSGQGVAGDFSTNIPSALALFSQFF